MKNLLFVLSLLFFSHAATAAESYLFTPLASYHVDRDMGECEVNPGLVYQRFQTDHRFTAIGAFRNSGCDTAALAFVGWETQEAKRFLGIPYGYGIMGGLTTGYDTPVMAAPFIRVGDRDNKLTLQILTIPHPTKGVYGLGVRYRIGQ
jgi:hypothetical protein